MIPQPFIDAIKANRNDDLPRLIAADWLEEHGECERAEFIRVQLELGELAGKTPWHAPADCTCDGCNLARRERKLLNMPCVTGGKRNAEYWFSPFDEDIRPNSAWEWTRGFVSRIHCSWQDWLTHSDAILKYTPLERVVLTDRPLRFHPEMWPNIQFELPQEYRLVYAHTQYA